MSSVAATAGSANFRIAARRSPPMISETWNSEVTTTGAMPSCVSRGRPVSNLLHAEALLDFRGDRRQSPGGARRRVGDDDGNAGVAAFHDGWEERHLAEERK